jgi:hypothetical protein
MIPLAFAREAGQSSWGRSLFPGRLMGACYCDSVVGPRSCVGSAHVTSADTWVTAQHCRGSPQSIITRVFGLLVIAPLCSVT